MNLGGIERIAVPTVRPKARFAWDRTLGRDPCREGVQLLVERRLEMAEAPHQLAFDHQLDVVTDMRDACLQRTEPLIKALLHPSHVIDGGERGRPLFRQIFSEIAQKGEHQVFRLTCHIRFP